MATTACTLKHIQLTTVMDGARYFGGCDAEGVERGDGEWSEVKNDDSIRRQYFCTNCSELFQGSESFYEVRHHFGKLVEKDPPLHDAVGVVA